MQERCPKMEPGELALRLTLSPPKTVNTDHGNNVPHVAGPEGAALGGAQPGLRCSFSGGLTGLEERRYVAGVLRRLLRSFPGAHGCRNPHLELSLSRVGPPKKKATKRRRKITSVPTKAPLKTHGRLRGLAHASNAICRPPSWG
ncbi:hypothetical protein L3Q82_014819 [Scortum barcoo]|uniref:Uncharacterized protein n=1 Tax=Scortum barcoo TaxID=214431 RepID=A0ACB8VSI8_9TELE|nr:hypothetical protein L3Q82_014819 [Scortum barcoo]